MNLHRHIYTYIISMQDYIYTHMADLSGSGYWGLCSLYGNALQLFLVYGLHSTFAGSPEQVCHAGKPVCAWDRRQSADRRRKTLQQRQLRLFLGLCHGNLHRR